MHCKWWVMRRESEAGCVEPASYLRHHAPVSSMRILLKHKHFVYHVFCIIQVCNILYANLYTCIQVFRLYRPLYILGIIGVVYICLTWSSLVFLSPLVRTLSMVCWALLWNFNNASNNVQYCSKCSDEWRWSVDIGLCFRT